MTGARRSSAMHVAASLAHPGHPATRIILVAVPALLAAWLYRPILGLPNIYDTLLHIQLADNVDFLTVWLPQPGFAFYRPLVFLPFLAVRTLFGDYPSGLLQSLNLIQHAANAALASGLAWRLSGRRWTALAAGLLLAAFPLAFQALAIYGNNAYLTVTGLLLVGLHVWLAGSGHRGRVLAVIQLAALLVHENGALLLPLIAGWEGVRRAGGSRTTRVGMRHLWPRLRPLAPAVAVLVVYLAVYPFLPRGAGPGLDFGGNDPWLKLLLFLQASAFPLTGLAQFIPHVSATTVILAGAAVTALAAAWTWRRPALRPILLFGLGWWVAAALLVATTLPTYYIADGARLLYPGGVGLALFWSAVVSPLEPGWRPALARGAVVLGAVLLLSAGIVRGILATYTAVVEPVAVLVRVLDGRPADEAVVWVNPPQWIAPPRNAFPLGTELAPLLGSHLFAAELLAANGAGERDVTVLLAPGLRQETDYHAGLYELTAVNLVAADELPAAINHIFVTEYEEGGLQTRYAGRIERGSAAGPASADLGPYRLETAAAGSCALGLFVELSLRLPAAPRSTATLFVQALAADGSLVAQLDGPPLGIPPARLAGEELRLVDRRRLDPVGSQATEVLIGAYDFATGERFPATAGGASLRDNALRVPIQPGVGCSP